MFNKAVSELLDMSQAAIKSSHLSISEVADLLGVSVSTLRNWDRSGKLRPRRHPINGYRIYDRSDIERLKEQIEGTI